MIADKMKNRRVNLNRWGEIPYRSVATEIFVADGAAGATPHGAEKAKNFIPRRLKNHTDNFKNPVWFFDPYVNLLGAACPRGEMKLENLRDYEIYKSD